MRGEEYVLPNKLLLSLLLEISETLAKDQRKQAQVKAPELFCSILKADGCAVYQQDKMLNIGSYQLQTYNSSSSSVRFAGFWEQYGFELNTAAKYINKQKEGNIFDIDDTWRNCLILPLMGEVEIEAVLLIVWIDSSPLDHLGQEKLQLLQPISQMLSKIYCTSSEFAAELQQREKSLLALYQKAEQELENNRKQVSLELHDEVGQVLTSILLQLKMLQQAEDLEYVKGRLGGLHHITLQTLEEVRRISRNLRPGLLEKLGLQAAVEAHVKEYIDATGIMVEFRPNNLEEPLSEQIETIMYRAVQEGLTNIARHSQASKALINLSRKGDNLFLQIWDNGKGIATETETEISQGLGLMGIKERVKMANGKFWVLNQNSKGLSLNILLPLAYSGGTYGKADTIIFGRRP